MKAFLNKPTLMLDANKILNSRAFSPHAQAKMAGLASIPNKDQPMVPQSAQAHQGISRNSPINGQALGSTIQTVRMVGQKAPAIVSGLSALTEEGLAANADAHKPRNIHIVVNHTDLTGYAGPI